MRARFTSHIASLGFDYPEGRVVEVGGKTYAVDRVPEKIGRDWLASGVLEPVPAAVESASLRSPETAARAAAQPRRAAVKES